MLATVLHGADARAALFADAVGTSVEDFVKALSSADFRRVTDVRNRGVIFAALGERIILRHIATDRAIFARGALRAALWGQGQKPGRYDMMDVLGV